MITITNNKIAGFAPVWASFNGFSLLFDNPGNNLSSYDPHVSLGYFANKEHAELATPQIEKWTDAFKKETSGQTITSGSNSLYGFTDMATFLRN
ncbi:MAG: hypothetical protein O7E52_20900 [Candidatus Poribacteria bacterium]|nr:hypothetical protein [Candidatus Poribacteria bacterium]